MGAIIGGISGFAVLLMTWLGTRESPKAKPIQEIRVEGMVRSTDKASLPGMLYPGIGMEPLRRSDYNVIGRAEGKGCAHYVALWPIPFFWTKREGGALKFFHADPQGVAENAAWYEAIKSMPAADALFSPRIDAVEDNKWALWYRRSCVTLYGKGLEIKLDKKPGGTVLRSHKESAGSESNLSSQNPNTQGGTFNPQSSGITAVSPAAGRTTETTTKEVSKD